MARERRRGRRDVPLFHTGAIPPSSTVNETQVLRDVATFSRLASAETISGLWTFNRGADVPFAVAAGSLVVTNLDSDLLDGQHGAFYRDASNLNAGVLADARVQQSNVTQHQAALSIAETQIPNGSLLARIADNETVSGLWTFSGLTTFTDDLIVNTNLAIISSEDVRINANVLIGSETDGILNVLHVGSSNPGVRVIKARGTFASRSAVQAGDFLGTFTFRGWDGADPYDTGAAIFGLVRENWTASAHGTDLQFRVTADGVTSGTSFFMRGTGFMEIPSGLIVGTDPGGTRTVRIGGDVRIGGAARVFEMHTTADGQHQFFVDANRSANEQNILNVEAKWNATPVARFIMRSGPDTTNKDDGQILLRTATGGALADALLLDHNANTTIYGQLIAGQGPDPGGSARIRLTHNASNLLRLDNSTLTNKGWEFRVESNQLDIRAVNDDSSTVNHALSIGHSTGRVRIVSEDLDITTGGVALGGGATATLGTIGGSGPTAAAQAQWCRIRINGVLHWIPVWT